MWAGRPLLLRQPFAARHIDEVITGCANPHYAEVNPARVAALRLGCSIDTPAWTVQRNGGSGMQALDVAFRTIATGRADLILAGGTEAPSHAPVIYKPDMVEWLADWNDSNALEKAKLSARLRPEFFEPVSSLEHGLTDPNCQLKMGQTAELLAYQFSISRTAADAYALRSHRRLAAVQEAGRLTEIEAMYSGAGDCYQTDDGVRPDTTLEDLARLAPGFEPPFGAVTAGNASQLSDGACWLLLASEHSVQEFDLPVLARIVACQWAAIPPQVMGLGSIFATTPLLQRHRLQLEDISRWEINEAFAAQVLACVQAWQDADFCRRWLGLEQPLGAIDQATLNADGGAISLGHPAGASGARLVLHLADMLRDGAGKFGIASECIGGGQGGAMLLEK